MRILLIHSLTGLIISDEVVSQRELERRVNVLNVFEAAAL